MSNLKVLIVGGGTGGHIIPGIALYQQFKQNRIRTFFLTGKNDRRYSILKNVDSKDIYYYRAPSFSKNIFLMMLFIPNFVIAFLKAILILQRSEIDAVIGMGGFVSAPALTASVLFKVPIYLCEQNTLPGRVTSFFARYAQKIYTTFNVTRQYLNEEERYKVSDLGNPIRKSVISDGDKENAKEFFCLRHCKKIILIIGGSQGALQLNELFLKIKKMFVNELKDTGIIWCTGDYSYNRFVNEIHDLNGDGSIFISSFLEDVGLAYKASDIAISRAGAGVIMEFAAVGLPSILIPYPYAAANHQDKNADMFDRAGAAIKVGESDASPENVGKILIDLLDNPSELARMANKASHISKINASNDIVDSIIQDISSLDDSL